MSEAKKNEIMKKGEPYVILNPVTKHGIACFEDSEGNLFKFSGKGGWDEKGEAKVVKRLKELRSAAKVMLHPNGKLGSRAIDMDAYRNAKTVKEKKFKEVQACAITEDELKEMADALAEAAEKEAQEREEAKAVKAAEKKAEREKAKAKDTKKSAKKATAKKPTKTVSAKKVKKEFKDSSPETDAKIRKKLGANASVYIAPEVSGEEE